MCMNVYMHVCVHVCNTCIHVHMSQPVHTCMCVLACVHVRVCVCMHVKVFICLSDGDRDTIWLVLTS